MKRILAALLIAAPMLAPAAQPGEWYGSVHLSKGWKDNADLTFNSTTSFIRMGEPWFNADTQVEADLSYTSGWGLGAAVGRRFADNWRAEFDVLWRKSNIGHFLLKDFGIAYMQTGSLPAPPVVSLTLEEMQELLNEDTVDISGSASLLTTAVNLYYDWPVSWRIKPYVGAGIGVVHADKTQDARITSLADTCTVESPCESSSKHKVSWDFTWQLMAGARLPLSDKWDATLGWRYADLSNVKFNPLDSDIEGNTGGLQGSLDNSERAMQVHMGGMHSIELSVIRRF